jgi:cytochrome c oxidase cbb3-type subunit 3
MPSMTNEQVDQVVNYVLSFSGREKDAEAAKAGEQVFAQACVACHGPEGKGMQALGAPNLTDNVWLYGGSEAAITESIVKGRNGVMPGMDQTMGTTSNKDAKLHLLTAYVYGLGGGQPPAAAEAEEPAAEAPAEDAATAAPAQP